MLDEQAQPGSSTPSCSPKSSRRTFLAGTTLGALGGLAAGWFGSPLARRTSENPPLALAPASPAAGSASKLAMPGPYPGRVIEVHHPGSVVPRRKSNGYTE